MDEETLEDYYYVMDRAFLDDSAALDHEEVKKLEEENPEEAEKV